MNQKLPATNDSKKTIWGAALIFLGVVVAVATNDYALLLIVPYILAMTVMVRKIRTAMGACGRGE